MSTDDAAPPNADELAALIAAADGGDAFAADALFRSLYAELHRTAARQLRRGGASATLGATTLLHECYLGLAGRDVVFPDRARFVAYAARAMRGLVIDHVRQRLAVKRGGAFQLTALDTAIEDAVAAPATDFPRLNDALVELQAVDPALAELVDLHFFCGCSFGEIAGLRGVSERTVQRDWQKARLLLHDVLRDD